MPLSILDDQRLLAQHREVHAVLGMVNTNTFKNHPVTKLYSSEHLGCLVSFHARTVEEMQYRGWLGHKTSVSLDGISKACLDWEDHAGRYRKQVYPEYGIQRDMHDLIERWTQERKVLRNELAAAYVELHIVKHQNDQQCLYLGQRLLDEFSERA